MTDEQEKSPKNENEPKAAEPKKNKRSTEDIDVEGALAALASLQDLARDESAKVEAPKIEAPKAELASEEIEEFERLESHPEELTLTSEIPAAAESPSPYDSIFPRPPVSVLHRGQLASVVPALLLIGIGGYLTFALTISNSAPDPLLILVILVAGLAITLLAQWLSASRWTMGNFFFASLLLLVGGTFGFLLLSPNINLLQGWPLLITALGTSFVLSDLFVPTGRRVWFLGLLLAIAGLAGLSITMNLVTGTIAQVLGVIWPIPLVFLLMVLLAPLFRRRAT
jgi:hypothetical protein